MKRAITPERILRHILLKLGKGILVLNIVNKFDTVLIKSTRFITLHHRNCDFSSTKGNN